MGMNLDTKERTSKRMEANKKALDELKLYSLTELEPVLGVTHRTLLTYVKDKKIKAQKIGGKWKVSETNLKAFINGES